MFLSILMFPENWQIYKVNMKSILKSLTGYLILLELIWKLTLKTKGEIHKSHRTVSSQTFFGELLILIVSTSFCNHKPDTCSPTSFKRVGHGNVITVHISGRNNFLRPIGRAGPTLSYWTSHFLFVLQSLPPLAAPSAFLTSAPAQSVTYASF